MRPRAPYLLALASLATLALPALAHANATGLPYFGPIVPDAAQACAAAWGSVLQLVSNIVAFAVTIVIVAIAPLIIAYAGFLYVVNPVAPGERSRANAMLLNGIVGIVIALGAWLFVNAILVALTTTGGIPAWTSALFNGDTTACLTLNQGGIVNPNAPSSTVTTTTTLTPTQACANNGGSGTDNGNGTATCTDGSTQQLTQTQVTNVNNAPLNTGGNGAQCSTSNTACSVSTLETNGLSDSQANVMSCIAVTESSGNPSTPPYNQTHPSSNSSACGTFQITKTTWNGAASGGCSDFASNCQNAACNAQVAATLVSQSGYSSWTCQGCNSKAASCVQTYGGGS